jgi:tetratricopeptide (TPR) repeat protein
MQTVAQALAWAVQQHQAGQLQQAEQIYRAILQAEPQQVDALHLLGVLACQVGQHEQASRYLGQALRLKPDFAKAHLNLGVALQKQGKLEEAQACYEQALYLQPGYAEAHNNLGNLFKEQGKLEEAQASLQQALRLKPDYAKAHNNLGVVLHGRGKLEDALASLQQALRLQPDFAEAHNNLGAALQEQGQLAEARACYQQALRLKPDYAEVHLNLGNAFKDQGELAEAQACYEQALHLQPDFAEAHWNRALAWLLAGDFEQGWQEYEWRCQVKELAPPRFPQPLWDGSPRHGQTILLWAEQGLGDTLHFIRYAPLVRACGGSVLLACQPALVPLVSRCPGIDRVLPQGSPLVPFDVWTPLLSLPRIFGTTLATVPAAVPYLFAEPQRCHHWREELSALEGFKIGIVWQGNRRYRGDRQRSLPLVQFAPLAQLPGVQLISLQKGYGSEQVQALAGRFAVLELGSQLDEGTGAFEDTAAVLEQLDLVIAPDTALAHLAGGLGLPVWLALPFIPHWAWLREREDSPWYPSMRLFRQRESGNWAEVFERITATLKQRLAQASGAPMASSPAEGG